jgi:hypothetical protein
VGQLAGEQFGGKIVTPAVILLISTYRLRLTTRLPGRKYALPFCAEAVEAPTRAVNKTTPSCAAEVKRKPCFLKVFAAIVKSPSKVGNGILLSREKRII